MKKIPDYSAEFVQLRDKEKRRQVAQFIDRQYSNPYHPLHEYHMKISAMTVSEKISEAKRVTEKMRAETLERIEQDTPRHVLEAFGGADAMLSATEEKERRGTRSKNRKRIPPIRRAVLLSFIESEAAGRTFAEAANIAHSEINGEVDIKSIRNWLRGIVDSGVCKISPPASRTNHKQ